MLGRSSLLSIASQFRFQFRLHSVLVVAEHNGKNLNRRTLNVLEAAHKIGNEVSVLVAGVEPTAVANKAKELSNVERVLVVRTPLKSQLREHICDAIFSAHKQHNFAQITIDDDPCFNINIVSRLAAEINVSPSSIVSIVRNSKTFSIYPSGLDKAISARRTAIKMDNGGIVTIKDVSSSDVASDSSKHLYAINLVSNPLGKDKILTFLINEDILWTMDERNGVLWEKDDVLREKDEKWSDSIQWTLLIRKRNTLYRSLIGENAFKVFGRVAIGLLLFFTFYSWINVYEILRYTRDKFVSTTQPSILFQQRYLPIGGADLKFNQPWDLGNATILTKFSQLESGERFILSDLAYSPGLGNLMFEYAALNYYAQKHNASIIIPSDCLLLRAFGQLKRILVMDATVLNGYLLYREDKELPIQESKHCCQFLPEMKLFNELNIEVVKGYFQTYEYFNSPELEADIRQSFQFLPGVIQRAEGLIQNIKKSLADQLKDRNYTFVGVHVRHGMDVVLHQRNQYHGHVTAPAEYFQHAIIKMRNKFRHQKVVFLIVGDDLNWARASLQKFESIFPGEMQFVKSGFREVDMAVLTLCDHTIMSTGTFSWWIGYLTNGTVFYYGNWPKRGTVLDIMISDSKYFPERWIPVV